MGLFDSVYLPCPRCGEHLEFQSKVFPDAYLRSFPADAVPTEMAADITCDDEYNRCACVSCQADLRVVTDPELPKTVRMRLEVADGE